jgi:hypothetical protein
MDSTLYSSVATLGNSLDDGLQTFMSEALYTNNLTQKEVDALSAAGITSSKVICYFLVLLDVSKHYSFCCWWITCLKIFVSVTVSCQVHLQRCESLSSAIS